jgi:hypothetical protein
MRSSSTDAARLATSKAEAMLAVADIIGIDLDELAPVRGRLASHEHERNRTASSPRREELDEMIAGTWRRSAGRS